MAAKNEKPELFLIDGNSLAYRAFFALPESISTSDGRPTNAIYGFASMLVKIITEHHPGGVVVAWDAGMSGREKQYEDYKAQRKPRPDLLSEQWPHMMPLVEAFGYQNVKVEGYEADDVIASLVRRAREEKIPVMVVSGDRDVYQVVEDGVRVMTTSRGITETKVYDREGVIERYGVPPELVTDLIGLKGDTSDNIPGVPGIGDKTAAQLLQEFGSLEDVLANVDKISGAKRKQNLTEHADDARVSKQLATMHFDIETGLDFEQLMGSEPDWSSLREFSREFELRVILERLEEGLPEGGLVPGRKVEREVSVEAVEGSPSDLAKGPVALAISAGRWAAADSKRVVAGESKDLKNLAGEIASHPLIAHDAKSLGGGRHGLLAAAAEAGVDLELEHDTMLAAYLLDPARRNYDLVELAADAGLGVTSDERRATRRSSWNWEKKRKRPSSRPKRRASSPSSPTCSARGLPSGGLRTCCARSSCRWSTCWRRWNARESSSTPSAWPRSARGSRSRSPSWSPRSTSLPGTTSRLAPPNRSPRSCSRSWS